MEIKETFKKITEGMLVFWKVNKPGNEVIIY